MQRRKAETGKGRRGNAMVEFAVAFSVLFPLLYGTFQFGLAFFRYNILESAVRSGARYASYRTYDSATTTPSAAYTDAVKRMVIYGDPAGGATPLSPGLGMANVRVTMTFTSGVPRQVTVALEGYPLNVLFRTYTISRPAITFPYIGRYAPPV
jgi:Flp pilus assembly protein TadG